MNFPPRAFIIGAQKAATTSLAFLLDQHPAIGLSDPKETHYFSVHWDKGEDWYRTQFPNPSDDVMLLDASTSYAMAPISDDMPASAKRPRWGKSVPERIHSYTPDAKFIYMLRRPADRTYSAYWHNVRSGEERLPFREAIAAHPVYLETGKYHAQISVFLDKFALEDFFLIDFRSFSENPIKYAQDCLKFLGTADCEFPFESDSGKNKSFQFNKAGRAMQKLLGSKENLETVNRFLKDIVPENLHDRLKSVVSKGIPPMSDSDRAFLEDYFAEDNEKLHEMTGFEYK